MKATAFEYISANAVQGEATVTTEKSLRTKGGCPFASVVKKVEYEGAAIGQDYVEKVHEAQGASCHAADFKASPTWHKVFDKFFNVHKNNPGALYLRIVGGEGEGHACKVTWIADGGEVGYEDVEPWLYAADKPKPKGDSRRQLESGVDADKQVRFIMLSADNITEFEQGGRRWKK